MKVISGKRFCRVLESRGWTLKRIHGSHHIYAKEGVHTGPRAGLVDDGHPQRLRADRRVLRAEVEVNDAGVVAFGRGRVVEDREEARTALQMLLDKYAPHLRPGVHYRPSTDEELRRTAVYRIDIETWSGKQKEVAEDFPGAFTLAAPPVPFPERVAPSD